MNEKKEIELLMSEYDKAHHDGNGARIAAMFLDNAVIIPAGKPKIEGRAAIDHFYAGVKGGSEMKTISTTIEIDKNTATVHGETGWGQGRETRYLCFVNVLQLTESGWRYRLLTWNTSEGYLKEA